MEAPKPSEHTLDLCRMVETLDRETYVKPLPDELRDLLIQARDRAAYWALQGLEEDFKVSLVKVPGL